ncbi:SOS response-associated peptidase [Kroppenstedtia pulmonis]|uniref:Abasic site processing protein n=1 Tax=Kroppenstedtia pulmonis TaxID=1380685 RepID=A0A7D4BUY3_9BACL|nr:SOS response-associated peptidase [Kroppenstedtia pulmonis]QKG83513.1 SOS response-associated peptidase [Kroppenstedtia pulmonis]
MCGRFTLTVGLEEIIQRFQLEHEQDVRHVPRYNIAPTQQVPVIVQSEGERRLVTMRWGLIPRWAKDSGIGSRLINARSETLTQKPAFRRSFFRHRCLVPSDGFFEWTKDEQGKKKPVRIVLEGEDIFAFAGLFDEWQDQEGRVHHSFTIVTTRSNEKIKPIHHRMPVILHSAEESVWLDLKQDPDQLQGVMEPRESEIFRIYPVSTLVNSPANDHPNCIQKIVDSDLS